MSPTAVVLATLLHAAVAFALWWVSPLHQADQMPEAIEITMEQAPPPAPPEPPPPIPQPPAQATAPPPPPAPATPPAPLPRMGLQAPIGTTMDPRAALNPSQAEKDKPPAPAQAAQQEAAKQEPAKPVEAKPEAAKSEPEKPEPQKAEPEKAEPPKAEEKAEPPKAEEKAEPPAEPPKEQQQAALAPPQPPQPAPPTLEKALPPLEPPPAPVTSREIPRPAPTPPPPPPPKPAPQPAPRAAQPQRAPPASPLSNLPQRAPREQQAARPSSPSMVNPADVYGQRKAQEDYLWGVIRKISSQRYYPKTARENSEEGLVVAMLTIARDGRLIDVSVSRSSGYRTLDNAVLEVIRAAAPYPPLPNDVLGDRHTFLLPLNYKRNDAQ